MDPTHPTTAHRKQAGSLTRQVEQAKDTVEALYVELIYVMQKYIRYIWNMYLSIIYQSINLSINQSSSSNISIRTFDIDREHGHDIHCHDIDRHHVYHNQKES